MNNKITKFLGDDPKAAVEGNRNEAEKLLAKTLGWRWELNNARIWVYLPKNSAIFTIFNLETVHEAELAVIEKVGKFDYGEALISVNGMSGSHLTGISSGGICEIATADAPTRVAAMLLALSKEGK